MTPTREQFAELRTLRGLLRQEVARSGAPQLHAWTDLADDLDKIIRGERPRLTLTVDEYIAEARKQLKGSGA